MMYHRVGTLHSCIRMARVGLAALSSTLSVHIKTIKTKTRDDNERTRNARREEWRWIISCDFFVAVHAARCDERWPRDA